MRLRWLVPAFLLCGAPLHAQPTFKLGVGPHLYPAAVLKLAGSRLERSAVKDDPGFRLQFHVLRNGKSYLTRDARLSVFLDLPTKEAGDYTAVLELFYPSYKGGKDQKGQFKAISPFVVYQVAAPGMPLKVLAPAPALVVDCGKGDGRTQDVKLDKDYGYKLIQGKPVEAWPAASRKHAWTDPKAVRFEVNLPKEIPGTLRLHLVDGDGMGRKCKVTIQGRPLPELADFAAAGKEIELPLSGAETKMGKIEVSVESTGKGSAVVSGVTFTPAVR